MNSLWPCYEMWWHRTWSALVKVMACKLTAPGHHLNQWWLRKSEILRYSHESNLTVSDCPTILYNKFKNALVRLLSHLPYADVLSIIKQSSPLWWMSRFKSDCGPLLVKLAGPSEWDEINFHNSALWWLKCANGQTFHLVFNWANAY